MATLDLPDAIQYVTDSEGRRVAVQIDLETFQRIEALLENAGLVKAIQEAEAEEALDPAAARTFYRSLRKAS
jgi:hypothetical protein